MSETSDLEHTLSKRRRVLIVILCLVVYLSEGMTNSVPSPIFPTKAESRGVSQTMVGIIIGSFNVFAGIFAVVMLVVASPTNVKSWFCIGAVTSGVTSLIFGELIHCPPGPVFFILCIITRAFRGCGSSALWGSGAPIVFPFFPKWRGRLESLIEFMMFMGIMLGPPIASFLSSLGGYTLPFLVTGLLQFCLGIICFMVLHYQTTTTSDDRSLAARGRPENKSEVLKFMSNFDILITSIPLLINTVFLGFTTTAFSPYLLVDFGIGHTTAGLYFIPYTLISTIGAVSMGPLVDKGYGGLLYCLGAIGGSISFLVLAIPAYLNILANMYYIEAALMLSGLSLGALLPSALLVYVKVGERNRISSTDQLQVFAASWVNFLFALGQTYGQAFLGGIFFQEFWFYNSCLLHAAVSSVLTIGLMVYMVKKDLIWTVNVDDQQSESDPLITATDEDMQS